MIGGGGANKFQKAILISHLNQIFSKFSVWQSLQK